MGDNNRVLDEQTVDAVVTNLREMEPGHRTEMISQLLPFLGCFLAEILRAINLAQQPQLEAPEYIEDDETGFMQVSPCPARDNSQDDAHDLVSMVQAFDPRIPFGSKLTQIAEQCEQVAWHLHTMTARLRRLAGAMSTQVADRFLRLEALIASYVSAEVEVSLSLQVWSEGQLRTLIPYLNGGRTPETDLAGPNEGVTVSGAASSTDVVHVANSSEAVEAADEPEYKVKRNPAGDWEAATEEEEAMLRQHDQELAREAVEQEEADKQAYREFEAHLAQKWDDWAVRSELDRERPLPSRKRVRVTVCVGSAGGEEIGTAHIEGVMDHSQRPTVTFQVEESLLAGVNGTHHAERGPNYVATQASPQLATFHRDHVPGLSEDVVDFMSSQQGRCWLWQFQQGAVTVEEVDARFGTDVADAFQIWVAVQEDADAAVRQVREIPVMSGSEADEGSNASTVLMEEGKDKGILDTLPVREEDAAEQAAKNASETRSMQTGGDEIDGHGSAGGPPCASKPGPLHSTHLDGAETEVMEGEGRDDEGRTSLAATLPGAAVPEELEVADDNDVTSSDVVRAEDAQEARDRQDVEDREADPYVAPEAWKRVLTAWEEDVAVGASLLPDSALSSGAFEHQGILEHGHAGGAESHPASAMDVEGEVDQNAMAAVPEHAAETSSALGSPTERRESSVGGRAGGQTDLKGWLRQ